MNQPVEKTMQASPTKGGNATSRITPPLKWH